MKVGAVQSYVHVYKAVVSDYRPQLCRMDWRQ